MIYNRQYNRNNETKINYDPICNCKSAGIIPYTIHNGKLMFLFQRIININLKKNIGWNDFGGKSELYETTYDTASREFSEETSCLFYLNEINNKDDYNLLKNNGNLEYSEESINLLKNTINDSKKYFLEKLKKRTFPLYLSSKEVYISYLLYVDYIPELDIPPAEDIHIQYQDRYIRECKWFTIDEILNMKHTEFHKRIQITGIQNKLRNYVNKLNK